VLASAIHAEAPGNGSGCAGVGRAITARSGLLIDITKWLYFCPINRQECGVASWRTCFILMGYGFTAAKRDPRANFSVDFHCQKYPRIHWRRAALVHSI
jgi:hypothetical protein